MCFNNEKINCLFIKIIFFDYYNNLKILPCFSNVAWVVSEVSE